MGHDLLEFTKQLGSEKFGNLDFLSWCQKNININIAGKMNPFTIKDIPALQKIFENHSIPRESYQKAAQMRISTYALLKSLYRMDKYNLKVAYYFPTDTDVKDFAQDRRNPIIDASPYLSAKLRYDKADNLGLLQLGNSSMYMRGVWSKRRVKSVDADMLVKDEVDEADPENLRFADDRLLASDFGWIIELSQPSLPDRGINESFKLGDQQNYLIKCGSCGRWNDIVESFPDNFVVRMKKDGNGYRGHFACTRCKTKLRTEKAKGEWVARYPSRSEYHRSMLVSQFWEKHPDYIATKFMSCNRAFEKKNFYISIAGIPYQDSELCPFTEKLLSTSENKTARFVSGAHSSYMGIDVGDICHVVVFGVSGKRLRLIHCEEVSAEDFDRFCYLIETYKSFFVIDAMPYKATAKRLCRTYQGFGAIQYFKGEVLTETLEDDVPVVRHNRTESIDEMAEAFRDEFFELPNPRLLNPEQLSNFEEWKKQIRALEKERTEDKHGYEKIEYRKKVNNHYGMATNSAYIAFQIGRGYHVPDIDPVF
ncbi:MAG: phage terminase large subunit family protein [Spirochaetes bacterium]|nr:phage terminase large subunit family protein [Spirochaetota bacterium]MBN2771259.1 phage terminase large subunit family protein [Spirochaetota bacterium]